MFIDEIVVTLILKGDAQFLAIWIMYHIWLIVKQHIDGLFHF